MTCIQQRRRLVGHNDVGTKNSGERGLTLKNSVRPFRSRTSTIRNHMHTNIMYQDKKIDGKEYAEESK